MTSKDFAHHTPLYPESAAACHLNRLITSLGDRNLYDAVSQCNRCGYCATVCPTHMETGRETLSGRGRNQAVRLLIEEKLKKIHEAEESIFTCLLCGACTSTCYARVPTADIMLEARRSSLKKRSSIPARIAMKLLVHHRAGLARWLKAANIFKKAGLARLAGYMGVYHALGMPGLSAAEREIAGSPLTFLHEILEKDPSLRTAASGKKAAWLYFAPCGPDYLYPEVGLSTVRLLRRFLGEGAFFRNSCCGLISYNYGDIADARILAQKNILKFEAMSAYEGTSIPVVGDCSSCVAFMKSYEQLFTDDLQWRPRARRFARSVRDILEIIPQDRISRADLSSVFGATQHSRSPIPHSAIRTPNSLKVTYHDSCRACHGQEIRIEPRNVLKKALGKNYAELNESDCCCAGAGTFAFTQRELSEKILMRKISNIAGAQADIVLAGATSCLIQLEKGLKKYYPKARVLHYSVFLDKITSADS